MQKIIKASTITTWCCFYFLFFQFTNIFAQHVPQIWGVTAAGGTDDNGTVFHYTPSTNIQSLDYSMPNIAPGANPQMTDLTDGLNGKLYGMTYSGGSGLSGVIFEWDTLTNVYTKKVDLTSLTGNFPKGSLTLYAGKLYGMTTLGGVNNRGTIFEWDPLTNIITKKFDFSSAMGTSPTGSLTLNGSVFYGMTYQGGTANKGVIFEWDPATNIYTKEVDLTVANGANPNGSLELNGGIFYGLTYSGGAGNAGVIFSWDPSTNLYTKKIDLVTSTGKNPYGKLVYDSGEFYGMTNSGGLNSRGVIFDWNPTTNIYTKKIDFSIANGTYPQGSLSIKGSKLYGLTKAGGANDMGVIFEWDPATNTYTKEIDLNTPIGINPLGSLLNSNGVFYGLTNTGGLYNNGVIFQWNQSANAFIKKVEFNSTNGNQPNGSLVFYSGKYYGLTSLGGMYNNGVLFEWDPSTSTYTNKITFDSITNGGHPQGSLVLYGGQFYGLTSSGGANDAGVIFEWDPVTNICTKKIDLTSTNGSIPYGSLVVNGTKLYGMTSTGGLNNAGVIFQYDPSANIYTKKIDMISATGSNPFGSLIFNGTKFYGMTYNGGTNSFGVIFDWNPSTNVYTKRYDMDTTSAGGSNPYGSLIFNAGLFYGLTQTGGVNNLGTIFSWNPTTNAFTKKIDFDYSNGAYPYGTMLLSSTGEFYGLTQQGGANTFGVLFDWNSTTNIITSKVEFEGTTGTALGASPNSTQLIEELSDIIPVFGGTIPVQNMCMNTTGINTFTVSDADGDPLTFTLNSSNTTLLPVANITLTNVGGSNYQLSSTPIVGQTGSTTITVTANDGFGGIVNYVFFLNVNPTSTVTASASITTVCQGQSVILTGSGASSYSWTGGVTDGVAFVPATTTTYTVTGTITGCGSNTATQTITVNPIPVVTANASSLSICPGQSVTLTGGGAATYSWASGVINGVAFVPLSTATYTVTGTSAAGCTNTASATVTINPTISVTASFTSVCTGQSVTLTATGSGSSYTWSGGVVNGVSFTPATTTTYTVTGTLGACTATATQTITVGVGTPTVIANTTSNTICAGDAVTLTGSGATTYVWTGGVIDAIAFNPSATTTYTVTGTTGGCSNTATQTITVNPIPSVTANATNTVLCAGQAVTLTGAGATSYSWSGGVVDGVSFVPDSSGTYTVTGTSLLCSSTASVMVSMAVVDTSVTQAGNILTANSTTASYQWVNCSTSYSIIAGETNQSYTPLVDGSYAVIINESGCIDTSGCFIVMTTNINGFSASGINVSPNPSTGIICFDLGKENKLLIEVYNMLGQKIKTQQVTTSDNKINLQDNINGTYILKIYYSDEVIMKRLILVK